MNPQALDVRATARFVSEYEHAQPLLRTCALGALSDLRRFHASDPKQAFRRYNKIKGISPTMFEVDIAGGERLLCHWNDQTLFLVAIGNHEIVKRYQQNGNLAEDIKNCRPLPAHIEKVMHSGLFNFNIEEEWRNFANEADPDWITYLDQHQAAAADRILEGTLGASSKKWYFAMLVGGPGTGKTSILLNLFSRAFECDLFPQLHMSDQVVNYIQHSTGMDLETYRWDINNPRTGSHRGILLVDDPASLRTIQKAKTLAQTHQFQSVVVGFDPLQIHHDFTDAELAKLETGTGTDLISLSTCYRQKAGIGKETTRILRLIAASSPFLAQIKKEAFEANRQRITGLGNTFSYINPGGRLQVYDSATATDGKLEVERLAQSPRLWKHWPPYLIALDPTLSVATLAIWTELLAPLSNNCTIKLGETDKIKGVEFQHVILVLSASVYAELQNGFEGATQRGYAARRLLRIPISRAKDSITVFVDRS